MFLALLNLVHTASAQDISALHGVLKSMIEKQEVHLSQRLKTTLILDGEIVIEDSGHFHTITLPHIKALQNDGTLYDIGMISINAQETPTPGRWSATIALPRTITVLDENDTPVINITLKSQTAKGHIDQRLRGFMAFDGTYNNILVTHIPSAYTFTIPSLKINYDFQDNLVNIDLAGTAVSIPSTILFPDPSE